MPATKKDAIMKDTIMKAPKMPQKVLRTMVAISIVCVIILTAAAGLIAYLVASAQERQNESDLADAVSEGTTPMYRTASLIMVLNGAKSSIITDSDSDRADTVDTEGSIQLAKSCATLFLSDPDIKSLIKNAQVTITPVENSYFLRITATSDDPHTAANTANLVASAAPQVFKKYFDDAGRVYTVEDAAVPSKPYSEEREQTAEAADKSDTLHIVLIASLAALSGSMLLAVFVTAVIYAKQKRKYEEYQEYQLVCFGKKV